MSLYQYEKNVTVSLILSGEIVDLKIMQSDLLRAFWTISPEQDLFQRMDLCRNTADNINFYYETNSVNIKDHFFQ